jgi:hypothetical protein
MKDTIKYKGRMRKVHKGSRGGRYIISSGRKVYLKTIKSTKNNKSTKTIKSTKNNKSTKTIKTKKKVMKGKGLFDHYCRMCSERQDDSHFSHWNAAEYKPTLEEIDSFLQRYCSEGQYKTASGEPLTVTDAWRSSLPYKKVICNSCMKLFGTQYLVGDSVYVYSGEQWYSATISSITDTGIVIVYQPEEGVLTTSMAFTSKELSLTQEPTTCLNGKMITVHIKVTHKNSNNENYEIIISPYSSLLDLKKLLYGHEDIRIQTKRQIISKDREIILPQNHFKSLSHLGITDNCEINVQISTSKRTSMELTKYESRNKCMAKLLFNININNDISDKIEIQNDVANVAKKPTPRRVKFQNKIN